MSVSVPSTPFSALAMTGGEQTLFDTSLAGSYSLAIDLSNVAGGDTVVLKVYLAWTAGGLRNCLILGSLQGTITGPTADPNKMVTTIPFVAPYGAKFTITRTSGSVTGGVSGRVDQIGTVSVLQAATQATTTGEVTIGTPVTSGSVIVLLADVSLQGASASVKFRAKEAAVVAGSALEIYNFTTTAGAITDDGSRYLQSVPVAAAYSGQFTMIETGGSGYNVPYIACAVAA